MKKHLLMALLLLAAVPALGQQSRVNIQFDPQRNTDNILPFSTQVLSPEVRDDHTVVFRVKAPQAKSVQLTGSMFVGQEARKRVDFSKGDDRVWTLELGPLRPEIYLYYIIIDGVLARNPAYAQNGDALDLESCKNALIVNSKFDAGDDGICIKSGKDKDGRLRGRPCENVVVDGCTVFAGHGGFVVGSEMSGGVRNILVNHCQFLGTDVGLRFKSTRGRGGIVEKIFIRDISMTDIKTDAITFNMYYGGKSVAEMLADGDNPDNTTKAPVTEETPIFRNIDIQDVVCNGAGRAMEFNGLPEMPIQGINLKNIVIKAKKDATFTNAENITKENVHVTIE